MKSNPVERTRASRARVHGGRAGALACLLPVCLLLGGLTSGCEDGETGDKATISSTRLSARPFHIVRPGSTLRQRMFGADGKSPRERAAEEAGNSDMSKAEVVPFDHVVPEGWTTVAPIAPFRHINLRFEADSRAEITLAMYQDRGGVVRNANRWLGQVGLPPLEPAAIAALPKYKVFREGATVVEGFGPYQGMGAPPIEDGGLLGAIVSRDSITLFVKMVGPREIVEGEKERFFGFLDSLSLPDMPDPNAPRQSLLEWSGPSGWQEIPTTSEFREVTFRSGSVEMWLSQAIGGVEGNINRWAGQLQMEPLDDGALKDLERVPSLGGTAVIFDGAGPLQGMRDRTPKPGQRMTAAVIQPVGRGDLIITVKMTGPDADVAAARGTFDDMLRTLQFKDTAGNGADSGSGR